MFEVDLRLELLNGSETVRMLEHAHQNGRIGLRGVNCSVGTKTLFEFLYDPRGCFGGLFGAQVSIERSR